MKAICHQWPKMSQCDVSVCKAHCCYDVPLPEYVLELYKDKMVRPVIRKEDVGEFFQMVKAHTSKSWNKDKCPFLTDECRCNIYDDRPAICRIFNPNAKFVPMDCNYWNTDRNRSFEYSGQDIIPMVREVIELDARLHAQALAKSGKKAEKGVTE